MKTRLRYFVLSISQTVMDPRIINIPQAMSLLIITSKKKLQICLTSFKGVLKTGSHFSMMNSILRVITSAQQPVFSISFCGRMF